MLRPERMSRVSVAGSKRVMEPVVGTIHDLNLLHVTEYDGSFEGFEPGSPTEGADDASERLVTVRSIESILGVGDEDADEPRIVSEAELESELAAVRERVNDLDDRRQEIEEELRTVEERIDALEPFEDLGIDLDLLGGYDSLQVVVGTGDPSAVRSAVSNAEGIRTADVFSGTETVAAFAAPEDGTDEGTLDEALVGVDFSALEVPDGEGSPGELVAELEARADELRADRDRIESDLDDLREEYGGFLLSAEEQLTIEVQKREAPLSFATTDNAFVAEGWIPTDRYDEFEAALAEAAGDHVEVEELERADYDADGHHERTEPAPEPDDAGRSGAAGGGAAVAAGGEDAADGEDATDEAEEPPVQEAATDGGFISVGDSSPPTVLDNPTGSRPFETLVDVINRPKYGELDPTIALFLTFPAFFGFMIGDLGYGILYLGLGYWITQSFESDALRSLGSIGMWAGGFTALFGVLYGEFFGLHQLGEIVWDGHPPIHKGLQPHFIYYAYAWLMGSMAIGAILLVVGRLFDFVNNLEHGTGEAMLESGSWIVLTLGVWGWMFSRSALAFKPNFMFSVFAGKGMTNPATGQVIESGVALPLGFNGFPIVELVTLPLPAIGGLTLSLQGIAILAGIVLVLTAEGPIGLVESITQAFGHVVSYTRIAAVLLAKAGMALLVNLLVFGATLSGGEFHFIFFMEKAPDPEAVIFAGLVNGESAVALVGGWLAGIVVLALGHLLVLVLGVTSAGLQAVRLEYVEFFGKFYEGGGDIYEPLGQDRQYTTED